MRRTTFSISMALMLVAAACGGSASTGSPAETASASSPAASITPIESAPSPTATQSANSTIEPLAPSPTTSAAPVPQTTPDLAAIKPCSLFPVSEADTVSSVGYLPGKASTSGAGRTCTYADLSAHKSVAFDLQVGSSPAAAQQAYSAAAQKSSAFTVTQLSGVGDGAFVARYNQLGIQSTTIYVLTGYYLIAISSISGAPGPTDQTLETESALLVGRLH
jgi:hypothetical protein